MEKAIADEMIEQVKIEKLTRTPTIIPEFSGKILSNILKKLCLFGILLFW